MKIEIVHFCTISRKRGDLSHGSVVLEMHM